MLASDGYLPALRFRFLTPLFDSVVRRSTREDLFKPRLLDQAALAADQRVLDIGCGTGTLALMAKRRVPGADVVGLDADPDVLDIARRKAQAAGLDISLDQGLSTDLPYEGDVFDRVLSTLFFHHLSPPDKRATASEIARVLKPGGDLHLADWGRPADPLMRALFLQVRLFDGFERTRENSEGRLPEILEAAGLGEVAETGRLRTPGGSLYLYRAKAS